LGQVWCVAAEHCRLRSPSFISGMMTVLAPVRLTTAGIESAASRRGEGGGVYLIGPSPSSGLSH